MKSMYEIMNKNLITKSADYHGYENYYELTISFTTKNTINPNRNYIIKDENIKQSRGYKVIKKVEYYFRRFLNFLQFH